MPTAFPEWLEPMAATLTHERFAGPEWIFERKFDGIRLLAFKDAQSVRLFSRNRLPQDYPSVAQAIADLPVRDVILDGEVTGVWGRPGKVAYHIFDILWLDGRDLRPLPLEARRARLRDLPLREPLQPVASLDDQQPWERASREGWEGVVAKRRDSAYEHRRSPHWLKMKCEATQELVVGGFTDPQGRRVGLGALLVGYFEQDDLVYAGNPFDAADDDASGLAGGVRIHGLDDRPDPQAIGDRGHAGAGPGAHRPRWASASSRATSRRASRSAMSRRRSWSCLPRARPSSILARPFSLM